MFCWVKVRRDKHSFPRADSRQKKWMPMGNKFISRFMLNMEKERNHFEGEGHGQPSTKFFEDVIDMDLQ